MLMKPADPRVKGHLEMMSPYFPCGGLPDNDNAYVMVWWASIGLWSISPGLCHKSPGSLQKNIMFISSRSLASQLLEIYVTFNRSPVTLYETPLATLWQHFMVKHHFSRSAFLSGVLISTIAPKAFMLIAFKPLSQIKVAKSYQTIFG